MDPDKMWTYLRKREIAYPSGIESRIVRHVARPVYRQCHQSMMGNLETGSISGALIFLLIFSIRMFCRVVNLCNIKIWILEFAVPLRQLF